MTLSLILAPILAISFLLYKINEKPYKVVDEQAMVEIANDIDAVVDQYTFRDPRPFMGKLVDKLVEDKIYVMTPFGMVWAADVFKKEYTLLIDSNGGRVDILFGLLRDMEQLQKRGISFKCYIANAHSAAFTFAVSVCSKAILLRGGQMMQHHAYIPGYGIDNNAYLESLKMAKKEATALLIDPKEWMRITRKGNDDKLFSVEELKKYNIIQKVYGE